MTLDRIAHLVELGRYGEALTLTESFLSAEPEDPRALGLRTQCLCELERFGAALESADRMTALAPEDPWAHRLRSVALSGLGRHREALVAAREAVRLAPDEWRGHVQHALAAVKLRRHRREAARAAARAVELAPHEPGAHFAGGFVAQRRRQQVRARRAYQRTLALAPDHALAHNNLAALEVRFRITYVSRHLEAALRSDPQSRIARENLDRVVLAFSTLLLLLAVCAVFLAYTVTVESRSLRTSLTAALLVTAAWTPLAITALRLPSIVRRYALARVRHDPRAATRTFLGLGGFLTAYLICFSPHRDPIFAGAIAAIMVICVGWVPFAVFRRLAHLRSRRRHGRV